MRPEWESGSIRSSGCAVSPEGSRRDGQACARRFLVYRIKIFDCFPGKTALYLFYLSVIYQYFFYVVSGFHYP